MKRRPRPLFRSRHRRRPEPRRLAIVQVGVLCLAGEDIPVFDIGDDLDLAPAALDRLIAEQTGLPAYVRPILPGESDDLADRAGLTAEAQAELAEAREEFARCTHVVIFVAAPGVRCRMPTSLVSHAELN